MQPFISVYYIATTSRIQVSMIGTRSGIRGILEFYDKRDKQISQECDAQEVYFYEYNNHECCYGWEGDAPAYELIVDYFGEDVAKTIKRI